MKILINIRILVTKFGSDRGGRFSFPGGGFGQNVVIFWADMNSSIHINNKGKMYSINFTVTKKKFCLSLH